MQDWFAGSSITVRAFFAGLPMASDARDVTEIELHERSILSSFEATDNLFVSFSLTVAAQMKSSISGPTFDADEHNVLDEERVSLPTDTGT